MEDDKQANWEYKSDGDAELEQAVDEPSAVSGARSQAAAKNISWEAPEFIEHHHGFGWYSALTLITVVFAALIYLVSSGDIVATSIIVALGVVVGIFAGYKPATAKYEITKTGLKVNNKTYHYSDYKSFSIIREGQLSSLNLRPLKRLMPPVAAYFEPGNEKKIMNALGDYLPYEDRHLDSVDHLARRLRL